MSEQARPGYDIEFAQPGQIEGIGEQALNILKEESKRMSETEGHLRVLGRLDSFLPAPPEAWNQGKKAVSLSRRLDSGEVTTSEVVEAVGRLRSSYVPVSLNAGKRCVDGRIRRGYEDNKASGYTQDLGPQVQGGTVDEAIADRIIVGFELEATFAADVEKRAENTVRDSRFSPGDHTDNHADEDNSGCGAFGGQERKWAMLQDDVKRAYVENATKTMMEAAGLEFSTEKAARQQQQTALLLENKESYLSKPNPVFEALLRHNPKALETLMDSHNEILVAVNFVKDTTLHTSHYASQTDGKIEAFGLDAWNIAEEYGDEAQYLLQDAVQTLMDLTDGSLILVVRTTNEDGSDQPEFARDVELALAA